MTVSTVKTCCADAYASEAARFLLGDAFHPGGAALTRGLTRSLRAGPRSVVADIASGLGTSALQLARSTGCAVIGIDLAQANVDEANARARREGLAERVRVVCGDAEALPLPDGSVDGVLCECALCLFPDKAAAAREIVRVLRPGARLALSDVTLEAAEAPELLRSLDAYVACLGGAIPLERTAKLLRDAGLLIESVVRRNDVVAETLDRIEARLRVARLTGGGPLRSHIERAESLLDAARDGLRTNVLGYGVVIARR
ncbi:MAG TPA: methyltransferase domain-containing protein [Candidatus Limnocylindria bacterium]|nr:methyltransferase domain-containing protein [Candidatus Limnocylindria bacterium]